MSRFLFWLALLLLVWLALKKKFKQRARPPSAPPPAGPGHLPVEAEKLLRCTHCQVAFPASEAVYDVQGRVFCSAEHQQQHTAS
ncbi:PP0621 family protein [Massilia sp. W12]|uniref:PP0621 family protein n=1 Tax=Massilia sp. W12 TaxID=3126507 RepID=UPI0030D210D5